MLYTSFVYKKAAEVLIIFRKYDRANDLDFTVKSTYFDSTSSDQGFTAFSKHNEQQRVLKVKLNPDKTQTEGVLVANVPAVSLANNLFSMPLTFSPTVQVYLYYLLLIKGKMPNAC